ncbi:MAG: hypothetical protein ACJ74O_07820 [Frankiaceae bacterium]
MSAGAGPHPAAGGGGERAVPFYCPYCAEEDLRPLDADPGSYACGACRRSFGLRFIGVAPGR